MKRRNWKQLKEVLVPGTMIAVPEWAQSSGREKFNLRLAMPKNPDDPQRIDNVQRVMVVDASVGWRCAGYRRPAVVRDGSVYVKENLVCRDDYMLNYASRNGPAIHQLGGTHETALPPDRRALCGAKSRYIACARRVSGTDLWVPHLVSTAAIIEVWDVVVEKQAEMTAENERVHAEYARKRAAEKKQRDDDKRYRNSLILKLRKLGASVKRDQLSAYSVTLSIENVEKLVALLEKS